MRVKRTYKVIGIDIIELYTIVNLLVQTNTKWWKKRKNLHENRTFWIHYKVALLYISAKKMV